jgi:hypothetical protein
MIVGEQKHNENYIFDLLFTFKCTITINQHLSSSFSTTFACIWDASKTPTCFFLYYIQKSLHSVIFYHIALSIQTCHMLMAEPSAYDMFALLKKNGYVDGCAVNI